MAMAIAPVASASVTTSGVDSVKTFFYITDDGEKKLV
jgi:hypothetical protein